MKLLFITKWVKSWHCWHSFSYICNGYLPWLFAAGICRSYLPRVCFVYVSKPFFCVSKSFFFVSKSFWIESKPFLYVGKTFLFMSISLLTMFLFVIAVAVMGHRTVSPSEQKRQIIILRHIIRATKRRR